MKIKVTPFEMFFQRLEDPEADNKYEEYTPAETKQQRIDNLRNTLDRIQTTSGKGLSEVEKERLIGTFISGIKHLNK